MGGFDVGRGVRVVIDYRFDDIVGDVVVFYDGFERVTFDRVECFFEVDEDDGGRAVGRAVDVNDVAEGYYLFGC